MSYEYKESIKNAVNEMYSASFVDEENRKNELDEVYRKAEAFDAYHRIISKHIEQQYSHNKHDMIKRFVKIHDEYESGDDNE